MTDRLACGTHLGMRLHIDLGEPLCPNCAPLAIRNGLSSERRQTAPPADPPHIRDLRAVIAILADAMSSKARRNP